MVQGKAPKVNNEDGVCERWGVLCHAQQGQLATTRSSQRACPSPTLAPPLSRAMMASASPSCADTWSGVVPSSVLLLGLAPACAASEGGTY